MDDKFVDWLQSVDGAGGVYSWVTQRKKFPRRRNARNKSESVDQLIEQLLVTKRVTAALVQEHTRRGWNDAELIRGEARLILKSMCHRMHMPIIRTVGYAIAKTVKKLYEHVYFNSAQLSYIRGCFSDDAVIFMPTHRSYMDFLLVSLLCFNSDVPMPVVASGMDFMASSFIGETLRRCGSFFLRRNFGKDNLYWALFTEYVQSQLIETDHPLEFFIEGTRSRSGKSLFPKLGLLQICIEPFLRGQIYDLIVVPISISYDKILEEVLYAYEVFGFPKPKETTSALLKARDIMSKNFGNIYVKFGETISVRNYFQQKIGRAQNALQPDSQFRVNLEQKSVIKDLAYDIINIHNANTSVTVWPYACVLILQFFDRDDLKTQLTVGQLTKQLESLVLLVHDLGKEISINKSVSEDLRHFLQLHSNLFKGLFLSHICDTDIIQMQSFELCGQIWASEHLSTEEAVAFVTISNYANQMMYHFVDSSLLCLILLARPLISVEHASRLFKEIRALFSCEFVCSRDQNELDNIFTLSFDFLVHHGIALERNGCISFESERATKIALFIQPFIVKYHNIMITLLDSFKNPLTERSVFEITLFRVIDEHPMKQHNRLRPSCLTTLDVVKNALYSLSALQYITPLPGDAYDVDFAKLDDYKNLLHSISLHELPRAVDEFRAKL